MSALPVGLPSCVHCHQRVTDETDDPVIHVGCAIADDQEEAERIYRASHPEAALRARPVETDWEEYRRANRWPTPMHMRRAADALDVFTPAKYGDVLRWMADACDAALEGKS